MTCSSCGFSVPDGAAFCPECGVRQHERTAPQPVKAAAGSSGNGDGVAAPVPAGKPAARRLPEAARVGASRPPAKPAVDPPAALPPPGTSSARGLPSRGDLGALLARANLLRMRGQWAEAVERCTEALRLDPHSAAAHSLLGDIYENQGRLDKAIHWYELALEHDPDSVADKAKLTRARELQAVRRRTRDPRLSWAYLVSVAGVAFLFVAFVMAALVAPYRRTNSTALDNQPTPAFPPVAVPKVRPPDHTTEEDALRQSLVDDLHSRYFYATAVMLNPVDSEAIVTLQFQNKMVIPEPDAGRRGTILREGYRVADLAHRFLQNRHEDLRFVTIRALAELSSGSGTGLTDVVWRGRIDVARLGVPDDRASAREVSNAYDPDPKRTYWNPVAGF